MFLIAIKLVDDLVARGYTIEAVEISVEDNYIDITYHIYVDPYQKYCTRYKGNEARTWKQVDGCWKELKLERSMYGSCANQ